MAERLRASRERLMASELASTTRAWRLWAACVDATVGYTREADHTYVVTLADAANIKRQVASHLLRRFNELDVFQWAEPLHPGSRDARILELPNLDTTGTQSGAVSSARQVPRVGPLHSNVESSKSHRSIGIENEEAGTPSTRSILEGMTIEELHDGVAKSVPGLAELYAAELERRNIAPRRRPAWLDD